jgi:hypothetical protein
MCNINNSKATLVGKDKGGCRRSGRSRRKRRQK